MTETSPASRPAQAVAQSLAHAQRLLAVTHVNPDGDAVGSLVGIGHIAAALGIDVRLYCETPFPAHLGWINSPAPLLSSLDDLGDWVPDHIVFLDCADIRRPGDAVEAYINLIRDRSPLTTICIDHHTGNPNYADINWVDPAMSATGILVGKLAKEKGLPLAGNLGEALCLAIVSDTGSFSYANTNATALEMTAEIVRHGLSMAEFTVKYENNWTLSRMHLWGELMREVQLLCDGKVVLSVVTDEILARYKAPRTDLEGYASWLRRLAGTKVVVLTRPARSGSKISLRSMGDIDVQAIAAEFGGGGHKGAAGVDMPDAPTEAAARVMEAVSRALGEACGPLPAARKSTD